MADACAPPRLLASASDAREAAAAARAGADIVDLKDPARGVLGPCDDAVLREAAAGRDRITPGRPLSAALGAAGDPGSARRAAVAAGLGFDFLKAGLDGVDGRHRAVALLRAVAAAARGAADGVRLIAASYADAPAAGALDPALLPEAAAEAGLDGCLLDTAVKDGRGVTDHLGLDGLAAFLRACREHRLIAAVAGSMAIPGLAAVVALGPDIIGARAALCSGGRLGRLDPERVRRFRAALRSAAAGPAPGR